MSATEKKKLENSKIKQARALHNFREAQEEYERLAAKQLPGKEKARRAMQAAKKRFRSQQKKTQEFRKLFNTPDYDKLHPERVTISPCKSSRYGNAPRRIVLHITVSHNRPGLADLDAILNYFGQLSTQASSHIVNDEEGHDGRSVPDEFSAWTQAAYNRDSLSVEQIQYADLESPEAWKRQASKQLDNTAAWIAHWSHLYNIPIVHSTSNGVCEHRELGAAGGGHSDVGPNYPLTYVLEKAQSIKRQKYGS